jgi:hypothetical protein
VADLIGWSKAKSCLGETGKPAYRCFLALGGFAGTAARRNPERSTVVDLCRAERPAPFLFGLLLDGAGSGAVGLSPGLCLALFDRLFLLCPRRAVAA